MLFLFVEITLFLLYNCYKVIDVIYLNYNKEYPVTFEALDTYNKASKEVNNDIKIQDDLIKNEVKTIADLFNVMDSELIFTSGKIESHNLAMVGMASANHKKGKHIIVSCLEDKTVYRICDYLSSIGFEISYVKNTNEGLIDFDDLKRLVKDDTILVCISAVNDSVGVRQPLKMIRQIIKKENPATLFYSDFSNAIGKIAVNFHDVDIASISSNLLGGPKGIGLLYKAESVKINPLLYGGNNISSCERSFPLIKAFSQSIKTGIIDIEKKEHFIARLNEKIVNALKNYNLLINNTNYSISHVINISVSENNAPYIVNYLREKKIYVGFKEGLDTSVMAIYNDKKRATNTIVISLCYKTTTDEVNTFINEFINAYNKYEV